MPTEVKKRATSAENSPSKVRVNTSIIPRSNQMRANIKLLDATRSIDIFMKEAMGFISCIVTPDRETKKVCKRLMHTVEQLDGNVEMDLQRDVIINLHTKGN